MTKTLQRIVAAFTALFCIALSGCGARSGSDASKPLVLMASPTPQTEILKQAEKLGLFGDVKIQIRELSGEVDPNQLLAGGDIDANFFQHRPYLKAWQSSHQTDNFVMVTGSHIEPLGLYSHKISKLADLPQGATVALAADPTNQARGLALLQAHGVVKLKESDPTKIDYARLSVKDVVSSPRNVKLLPVDRPRLPATLDDAKVDLSVINGANALEAGIKPAEQAIALESLENNPFVNGLVTRKELADDPRIKKVAEALDNAELKKWVNENYKGSVVAVPAGSAAAKG